MRGGEWGGEGGGETWGKRKERGCGVIILFKKNVEKQEGAQGFLLRDHRLCFHRHSGS